MTASEMACWVGAGFLFAWLGIGAVVTVACILTASDEEEDE